MRIMACFCDVLQRGVPSDPPVYRVLCSRWVQGKQVGKGGGPASASYDANALIGQVIFGHGAKVHP